MRLVLDNIIFFMQRSGGGSVYWAENIKRIETQGIEIQFSEPTGNFDNIFYEPLRGGLRGPIVKEKFQARLLSFLPYTKSVKGNYIFHSSYYRISKSKKAINIVTIHDFMPEMFFGHVKKFYHAYRKKIAIEKADAIICVSENTRKDLLKYYPKVANKPITTIHLGIADDFFKIPQDEHKRILTEDYILFVGRRSHYKNFSFAASLLTVLDQYHLVVIGEDFSKDEMDLLLTLRNRVTLIKNPDNQKLNQLYNGAFCLLYPSSYEGFGIPVIEAMRAGCPVVALNVSSIPEIAGGAALLLDELTIPGFSAAINSLKDSRSRSVLIEKGFANSNRFSWDRATQQLVSCYEKLWNGLSTLS